MVQGEVKLLMLCAIPRSFGHFNLLSKISSEDQNFTFFLEFEAHGMTKPLGGLIVDNDRAYEETYGIICLQEDRLRCFSSSIFWSDLDYASYTWCVRFYMLSKRNVGRIVWVMVSTTIIPSKRFNMMKLVMRVANHLCFSSHSLEI